MNKVIPSHRLIGEIKKLINDSGDIKSESGKNLYGEIVILIREGKLQYIRKTETIS